MTTEQQDPIEPRRIGFIERRWNMVKAFAKKSYEHLFSVKTWVSAGVILGTMAFLGSGNAGKMLQGLAEFTAVTPENLPFRIVQSLAIGTALNAGIAMYKEAKRCDDCDALATKMEKMKCAPAQGKSPQVEHSYAMPDQLIPAQTPPGNSMAHLGRD